ncbi:MAG: sulfite exporter TauE/SafE family protein [Chloroflexota bacterium]|nr:sulfite exporter TauE/SafE family protein [Chloroflexota bacterium]
MRRRLLLSSLMLALAVLGLLPLGQAQAHPLGNFTINHYSALEFSEGSVRILYVLDFAEIPTLQQMKQLDTDGDGALSGAEASAYLEANLSGLVEGLQLEVAGTALPLRINDRSAAFVPGQGGLPTLRIEANLVADLPDSWNQGSSAGYYTDSNYEDRLGWREIVVRGGRGVAVEGSSVPAVGVSKELRTYPQDSLSSPLDRREATFTLVPSREAGTGGTAGQAAENIQTNNTGGKATDRVAALVSVERMTPSLILLSLLAALFWGATHALTPGHGKAVVAAYLVGARGTARHAAFLGLTVTVTHTIGVFALGLVTLYLSRYILPEVLYPWLNVLSGLLVVLIGITLFSRRLRVALGRSGTHEGHSHHAHEHHDHEHAHSHDHGEDTHSHDGHEHMHAHGHAHTHDGHTHTHLPPGADGSRVTWRSLLALGVSGGLVPCPSALVLLLSAISLDRLEFGMVLVVAFSIGLAVVLTGIGLLMVYARRLFERFSFEARMPRFLPVASAMAISLAGVLIVIGSLRQAGIV